MIRVLIVEDKPENRYLLRAVLQGHGYAVDEASNGAEALTSARQEPPNLIISDLLMPVMDGYTLLRQWKADERLRTIPFVVYTATYTEPRDERLALDLGADAFIIKPVEPELFVAHIEEVLEKKTRSELPPTKATQGDETGLLKEYSEVLIRKLEKKVFQLEQANRGLQEEIARRQQAEAELTQSRQDWEDIFQSIGHPTIIMDLEHGIVSANKAAIKVSGKSLDELLNAKCHDLFHKSAEPPQSCPMEALLESGSTERVEIEMEALGAYYLVSCTPVLDKEGAIRKVIHIATDITERKKSEEALRESETRYRALFSQSMDGIYVTSREGILLDTNQAFLDILGYKRDEIVRGDIRIVYANPSDRDEFVRTIEASGSVKDYPLSFKRKDGKEVECLLTSSVRRGGDGAIVGYQGIVRDITEQASLQKQLLQAQKMEAIGALAGGVAHDFNNLLQVALGYTELILRVEGLPNRVRADLKKINDSSRHGAELVQRLLTFSRKAEFKPQPLDLNSRITGLAEMLERTIPKMIEIQLLLSEDLARISADKTQIDQVLMNLAVNARDAMPEGGTLIFETANILLDEEYAGAHLDAKPGHHVILMVTDTGSGMDKQTLEHIFEPFYTTKRVGEGTGLGLAVVHGIVKQHGGHIRCYSQPGRGTTFKIYIPALTSGEEHEETSFRETTRGGSETILLVDDEELIRDLGSMTLTRAGYKVLAASNGKEALELYQAHSDEIALVLLDLIMPEMGGEQCLKALLSLNPSVKVVIASGYSAGGPTKAALADGAKGFVNKPYETRKALGVIREVLDSE
jgi:two-component system, cell cycle sensor histidine kinase and response regulator CckA